MPPTLYISVIPIIFAAAKIASSTSPFSFGGVTTTILGTFATTAGIPSIHKTDGNEPLP